MIECQQSIELHQSRLRQLQRHARDLHPARTLHFAERSGSRTPRAAVANDDLSTTETYFAVCPWRQSPLFRPCSSVIYTQLSTGIKHCSHGNSTMQRQLVHLVKVPRNEEHAIPRLTESVSEVLPLVASVRSAVDSTRAPFALVHWALRPSTSIALPTHAPSASSSFLCLEDQPDGRTCDRDPRPTPPLVSIRTCQMMPSSLFKAARGSHPLNPQPNWHKGRAREEACYTRG